MKEIYRMFNLTTPRLGTYYHQLKDEDCFTSEDAAVLSQSLPAQVSIDMIRQAGRRQFLRRMDPDA